MRVPAGAGKEDALLLCDKGAQLSLVRHSVAQRLGAGPGFPLTLSIQVVGEDIRDIHTCLYKIYLKNKSGQTCSLVAAGTDNTATVDQPPDLSAVLRILPDTNPEALVRPHGDIDVLIGACDARLLPFGGAMVGNFREHAQELRGGTSRLPPIPVSGQDAPAHTSSTGCIQGVTIPTPGGAGIPRLRSAPGLKHRPSTYHQDLYLQQGEVIGTRPWPRRRDHRPRPQP